eukprot:353069-Chlamydomonas_euryale.AAC.12
MSHVGKATCDPRQDISSKWLNLAGSTSMMHGLRSIEPQDLKLLNNIGDRDAMAWMRWGSRYGTPAVRPDFLIPPVVCIQMILYQVERQGRHSQHGSAGGRNVSQHIDWQRNNWGIDCFPSTTALVSKPCSQDLPRPCFRARVARDYFAGFNINQPFVHECRCSSDSKPQPDVDAADHSGSAELDYDSAWLLTLERCASPQLFASERERPDVSADELYALALVVIRLKRTGNGQHIELGIWSPFICSRRCAAATLPPNKPLGCPGSSCRRQHRGVGQQRVRSHEAASRVRQAHPDTLAGMSAGRMAAHRWRAAWFGGAGNRACEALRRLAQRTQLAHACRCNPPGATHCNAASSADGRFRPPSQRPSASIAARRRETKPELAVMGSRTANKPRVRSQTLSGRPIPKKWQAGEKWNFKGQGGMSIGQGTKDIPEDSFRHKIAAFQRSFTQTC